MYGSAWSDWHCIGVRRMTLLTKNAQRKKESGWLQLLLMLLISRRWRLLASRLTAGLLHDLLQEDLGGQDVG
jgi:hypothetical protein